ncbi:MAG: HAMP domain-containing protein [Archaeoglobaceae archaeon]
MKLTPKIILIVLIASVVPLLVLAQLTLMGVAQSGESARAGVVNVSQIYIEKAGQEAVKMKTEDLAKKIELYLRQKLRENPNLTTVDLMNDPDFRELSARKWGMGEYTWVLGGAVIGKEYKIVTVIYPTLPQSQWGKEIKSDLGWDKSMPELYNLTVGSFGSFTYLTCGYYTWIEPDTLKETRKYLCQFPVSLSLRVYDPTLKTHVVLIAGTGAYIDGYFQYLTKNPANPAENIAGEVTKSIEKASEQIYVNLGIAFAIAVVFILIIAYFTISSIANPIVELSRSADKISAGEVDTEIPFKERADEIGILSNSIERLKRSLKVAMQSLEEALK